MHASASTPALGSTTFASRLGHGFTGGMDGHDFSTRGSLVVVAASKKKDVRLTITLECTEQKESGVPGMSRYMTQKVSAAPAPRRNESRRSSAAGHRSG